jgi:membrane-bound lytic murein transglycosylase A
MHVAGITGWHEPMIRRLRLLMACAGLLGAACTGPPVVQTAACPVCPAPSVSAPVPTPKAAIFEPATYAELPGWQNDRLSGTLATLHRSCPRLRQQESWRRICEEAASLPPEGNEVRAFFETRLAPWRIASYEGVTSGLVTGYYEPLLRGSRMRRGAYRHALYAPPDDLLIVDLSAVNPDLRNVRLRGRLEGRRVVPYYSRAEIERGTASTRGKEIVWVDDAVASFFLQIQGSGRVQLDNGDILRVGYADQNGHPYRSIGRVLIERGELTPEAASMQGILQWAHANPHKLEQLLNQNPSYVFFRELPPPDDPSLGPPGAMGVPLTPRRSIAVDPRFIPLGAPVFLATTWPASDEPLAQLLFAQDTGGAIRGAVRADFFWGFGADAGELAGRMKQEGRMWLLWPRGAAPPLPQR